MDGTIEQPYEPSLVAQVLDKATEARLLYFRLVLLVGPVKSGKTTILQEVASELNAPLLNVNLELSRRMLYLTAQQRRLRIRHLLQDLVDSAPTESVLLDNTEVLLDVTLKVDPLQALQAISRQKLVVATWSGVIDHNKLLYAVPDHPEYRTYPGKGLVAVYTGTNMETQGLDARLRAVLTIKESLPFRR